MSADVIQPSAELTEAIAEEVLGWSKAILNRHKFVEDDGCLGILHSACDHCKQPLGKPHATYCETLQYRWVWRCSEDSWPDTGDPKSYVYNRWDPGGSIKDSWVVMMAMIKDGMFVYLRYHYDREDPWSVCYSNEALAKNAQIGYANAKTEELAICKAALLAFGVIK